MLSTSTSLHFFPELEENLYNTVPNLFDPNTQTLIFGSHRVAASLGAGAGAALRSSPTEKVSYDWCSIRSKRGLRYLVSQSSSAMLRAYTAPYV